MTTRRLIAALLNQAVEWWHDLGAQVLLVLVALHLAGALIQWWRGTFTNSRSPG